MNQSKKGIVTDVAKVKKESCKRIHFYVSLFRLSNFDDSFREPHFGVDFTET